MVKITIRAATRSSGEPLGMGGVEHPIDTVEIVVGDAVFTRDVDSGVRARELVVRTAQELGLDPPCTCAGCVSPALACVCHQSIEVMFDRFKARIAAGNPPPTILLGKAP